MNCSPNLEWTRTHVRHHRTSSCPHRADKRAAEEIANRQRCEDFDRFKPLFAAVQQEIESGIRANPRRSN